ncbi:putative enoyl-CoA hydratase domain protein [Burkholderia pseudomallei A79D]|nr:putative enoyl-CoA hydratase domain protein [Burkholderia pseudomallei A79D]
MKRWLEKWRWISQVVPPVLSAQARRFWIVRMRMSRWPNLKHSCNLKRSKGTTAWKVFRLSKKNVFPNSLGVDDGRSSPASRPHGLSERPQKCRAALSV